MASGPSVSWLKKLKDISSDVDDLIDQFHLEAEKHDLSNLSQTLHMKLKAPLLQCKLALKIKAIKKRFAAVVKQRTDFSAITKSLTVGHHIQHINKRTEEMPSLPNVDEKSVLGRNKEKSQIISKLLETNDQHKMKIVSIVGLGGSGKTTLAKLVFNEVKKHFEVGLWVHVTREFDVQKLIEKVFEAFSDSKSELHPLQHKVKRISEKLAGKRFLLVLDDVWTESQFHWEQFMDYLNCGTPGSRILVTTRSSKVAETVGSTDPFHLPFLSSDDSWRLFQQSLIMPMKGWEGEFEEVGKEIVKKCGGIPLAIKVLAGVLRGKERIEEWHALRDNDNLLHVQGQEPSVSVSACLKLSYFHLSYNLKPCFTICAVFPKGYNIDKGQLIDLWIAHDLVAGVDSLLDYNGHKCFNSLVQLSFLQDVEQRNGRVRCKMHDLVHDLAQSILGDEISPLLPQEAASSKRSYRYFSLTKQPRNLQPKYNFGKARAVYVDDGYDFILGNSLKNAMQLRSITMNSICTTVPTSVLQIKHLRYLCILKLKCDTLPEAISYIWSLQALHVPNSYLLGLPKSIGKLQRLRTLSLIGSRRLKSLPVSIGDCQMISTIDLYLCQRITVLPNSMERNKKLRVLRLGHTGIERLPPGITTLEHLECLDLEGCNQLLALPDGIENLKKLHILKLRSCTKLGSMPMGFGQLTQLQQLCLFVVGEGEKTAPISDLRNLAKISGNLKISNIARVMEPEDAHKARLKHKTNLEELELVFRDQKCWTTYDRLIVEKDVAILDGLEPPTGIKSLKMIGYVGWRYAQWMLNQVGVLVQGRPRFPCLTRMVLSGFPNLKHLQGPVELPFLKKLELTELLALKSISGGPFPSLVELFLRELPSLGEVWIVTERKTLTNVEKGGDYDNNCIPHYFVQLRVGIHLSKLEIRGCPKLEVKPHLPPLLESLELAESNEKLLLSPRHGQGSSLSSNDAYLPSCSSLNRLKMLVLEGITATSTHRFESDCGWECLPCFRALEHLRIEDCDGLTELPESMRGLRSLRYLIIWGCCALCKLPDWLGELQSLHTIWISKCHGLSSLPPSMQRLTTLRTLEIWGCFAFVQLPEWLGELRSLQGLDISGLPSLNSLPQSLQHLTSLQWLVITGCDALHRLPECLGEIRSLHRIWIGDLRGLTCLPQSMCRLTSLEGLAIRHCPGLMSLPEGMKCLTALKWLRISHCPRLQRRCEREKGEDWHLISHIPNLRIK
ncbi:hypothetical protein ACP4OV_014867 [Aristida adscensionis]